jgi:hypothetical protein
MVQFRRLVSRNRGTSLLITDASPTDITLQMVCTSAWSAELALRCNNLRLRVPRDPLLELQRLVGCQYSIKTK